MSDEISLISQLLEQGTAVAGACVAGYFGYQAIKFILAGVTSSIASQKLTISRLEKRVDTMTNQLIRIDVKTSHALGLQADYDRLSRASREDQRKD
jgi:glutamine amidotransferase-like uncharacterized protein